MGGRSEEWGGILMHDIKQSRAEEREIERGRTSKIKLKGRLT